MSGRKMDQLPSSDTEMSGILFLCLGASTGISITFVSLLPVGPDTPSFLQELLNAIGLLSLSGASLIITVQMLRFIRNKRKYHENQTILWPTRCNHCAYNLGLSTCKEPSNIDQMQGGVDTRRLNLNTACVSDEYPVSRNLRGHSYQDEMRTDALSSLNESVDASVQSSGMFPQYRPLIDYRYSQRSTLFLKIFGVILIFTTLHVVLFWVSNLTCYLLGRDDRTILMISVCIQSIIYLVFIPVSMQFAVNYYDAVFVTTKENIYTMVLLVSGGAWIAVYKIAGPISLLYNTPNVSLIPSGMASGPCGPNTLATKVGQTALTMLDPFKTECAIVALCILWNVWKSFVFKYSLRITRAHASERDIFQGDSCITRIKTSVLNCQAFMTRRQDVRNASLHPFIKNLQKSLGKAWILSTSLCLVYFIFSCYIEIVDPFKNHFQYKLEIGWSADILFILPFFILYMHSSYVSRHSRETFTPVSPRKVEAHDVLLLLCSMGIFCHCIMRLAAGSGFLLSDPTEPNHSHLKAVSIYAIIYSLVIILMIWKVTSFLLQVQGIRMMNICEINWTLTCLVYITCFNGIRWLIESVIIINTWYFQKAFYGEIGGSTICTLLEPFVTLYGLHATVVAYEAYKSILQETMDRYTPVQHSPDGPGPRSAL